MAEDDCTEVLLSFLEVEFATLELRMLDFVIVLISWTADDALAVSLYLVLFPSPSSSPGSAGGDPINLGMPRGSITTYPTLGIRRIAPQGTIVPKIALRPFKLQPGLVVFLGETVGRPNPASSIPPFVPV